MTKMKVDFTNAREDNQHFRRQYSMVSNHKILNYKTLIKKKNEI